MLLQAGCYAGGYYAMGTSRQPMPGQNTICFYAFGHISHCCKAPVIPYKSHGRSSRRKKLWQHKMKLCALRVHFAPTGHRWPLDLIMSHTWTNTFSLQVVAGTRVHYSRAEGEQILHFLLCISCSQTALLGKKKKKKYADGVRFEGRQRRSVICVSAEMLRSSGYTQWELKDSLISFCASSVTLKSSLQEHESSHSDRASFSGVHTANPAGGWRAGHFSSTQHCGHWVQRSNNSTNTTNTTPAVACFSSDSQPQVTCCDFRIFPTTVQL